MGKAVAALLMASLAGGTCALLSRTAAMAQTPASQPAIQEPSRPREVTLKELSHVLQHQECDATVWVEDFLRVAVPVASDERKATGALFVVFPWAGDKAGIAKVQGILANWNRPMAVAWSNEYWVIVADSPPREADEHLLGLTGWIVGSLREYRPKADGAVENEAVTRPVASQPQAQSPTSQPAPRDQEGLQAELVLERASRKFSLDDDIALELRLVNKTRMKQKYRGGLGMTNAKHGCQFQIVTAAGERWSSEAMPDTKWQNYDDIVLEPGQSLTIGKWNLLGQRCSMGYPARTGKAVLLKDALNEGIYYVRWWDGNFQIRTPLYSPFMKLEITGSAATSQPVEPGAVQR